MLVSCGHVQAEIGETKIDTAATKLNNHVINWPCFVNTINASALLNLQNQIANHNGLT